MKSLTDNINEGLLDMASDEEVFDKKTQVRELAVMLALKEGAPKSYDRDACGRKLQKGDFVLFPEAKGIKGVLPLALGEILNVSKMCSIQTQIGRVNKYSHQCVKVTKEDFHD